MRIESRGHEDTSKNQGETTTRSEARDADESLGQTAARGVVGQMSSESGCTLEVAGAVEVNGGVGQCHSVWSECLENGPAIH